MPAQQIQKGTTYADFPAANSQVTANNLNDHVDAAVLLPGAITAQTSSIPQGGDFVMAARTGSTALLRYTLDAIKTLFTSTFLQLTGGTMTGSLVLNTSSPTVANQAASKGYVDSQIATISGVPAGTIIMWGSYNLPNGWLICNGQ